MNLNVELLQFYRCKSLSELLNQAAYVFQSIGFPHLVLKWSPTAGGYVKMKANSSIVWSNLEQSIGADAHELSSMISASILIGLKIDRTNTLERQRWRHGHDDHYRVSADAPKEFLLTAYQRGLISDFGEPEWSEFYALPLCAERERVLVLEAKTQETNSYAIETPARHALSVFACVYQCLHRPRYLNPEDAEIETEKTVLSRREVQCLHWLAAGKTFSEAATILDISERTLRFHVSNAKRRLGVATTMQAVVSAAITYGFDPKDSRRSFYLSYRQVI